MDNWSWDNPCAFRDQVDCSIHQATNLGKVILTREGFSWYGSNDPRAKIGLPRCWQHIPGDFLAVRPLNCHEIIDDDDDDESWADAKMPSGGMSRPGDGNDNHDGEGEEDMWGCEQGTREGKGTKHGMGKAKATEDRRGKGKRQPKGNDKGNGNDKRTPGGDDICDAVALQLQ